MTAAACVDRTERVQSGLPRVFVCALACISMQTPGGRCSFLRAGTMFQMARRRVTVRRTRQLLILVGAVGARRAECTCVVRPRVAGVANAAQHAVGEVGEACRVAGTRFALIKSRICPHWPVGTGAAVCTACLALRSLELASSTGFTGPPCVVKSAREACVARAVRRGVVLQAPRRVRRTLRALSRGPAWVIVLSGAHEARDVV